MRAAGAHVDSHVIPTKAAAAVGTTRTSTRASSSSFRMPPATQVGAHALPSESCRDTGKLRRLQAEQTSRAGPPQRAFALRPLSLEPDDKMLDVHLILDACDWDAPEAAEVRGVRYTTWNIQRQLHSRRICANVHNQQT